MAVKLNEMEKKQTAVELLITTINKFPELATKEWILTQCEEAKHEERQQIIDAYLAWAMPNLESIARDSAEKYYTETYGKD